MSNQAVTLGGSTSTSRKRIKYDYYATAFETTRAILRKEKLSGSILEPACGEGHISKVLKEFYPDGKELDEAGKKWSSAVCYAWFVWEHGFNGEPVIRFL